MNAEADAVKARDGFTTSRVRSQTAERPELQRSNWAQAVRENALHPMRTDWPTALCRRLERTGVVVRVVVAEVRGSGPREAGACMLVDCDGVEGTIGGGNLEWRALELARTLLGPNVSRPAARLDRFTLGRELAQCCGGVVQLFLERFTRADLPLLRRASDAARDGIAAWMTTELAASKPKAGKSMASDSTAGGLAAGRTSTRDATAREPIVGTVTRSLARNGDAGARLQLVSSGEGRVTLIERIDLARTPVWLYGAGHVGQAVVRVLADLPFEVTWLDSRAELFPRVLPDNVRVRSARLDAALLGAVPPPAVRDAALFEAVPPALRDVALLEAVLTAPRDARHIVMTHDHGLDYALCRAILERNAFAWLGLIGSESKAARFRSRLTRDGIAPERIARLVCPIGLPDIDSKLPAAIAIGIAAQLLREIGEAMPVRAPHAAVELRKAAELRNGASPVNDCSADRCASCHRAPR